MTRDERQAEAVVAGLGAHWEFECYCGQQHHKGDGFVDEPFGSHRTCQCGRSWYLMAAPNGSWSNWWQVDKRGHRLRNMGRRQRDAYDVG